MKQRPVFVSMIENPLIEWAVFAIFVETNCAAAAGLTGAERVRRMY